MAFDSIPQTSLITKAAQSWEVDAPSDAPNKNDDSKNEENKIRVGLFIFKKP
jgi:hypothetical protein